MLKGFFERPIFRWLLVAAFLAGMLSLRFAPHQKPYGEQQRTTQYRAIEIEAPESDNERLVDYTEALAVFTALLAAVTVVLAGASIWQGYITRNALSLARDEFNATHRPEIIVHSVEAIWGIIKDAEGMKFKTVGARITYFNKGTVPAKDVEIRALILGWPERLELEQSIVAPILDCPTEPILAGKPYTFDVKSQITANKADGDKIDDPAGGTIQKSEIKVYCFGTISYADSAGTMRQTGFRWRWKTPFSWIRETGNSYHFEY